MGRLRFHQPSRLRWLILAVLTFVFIWPGVWVFATVRDAIRTRRSAWIDAPNVRLNIDAIAEMSSPDPSHLRLKDGRYFRLAHLVAPPAGTTCYRLACDEIYRPLFNGMNQDCGLKIVGVNAAGETLVELWGFQHEYGRCGNNTWWEDREMMIPHWKNLTWQLISSGLFQLQPDVTDAELVFWQNDAIDRSAGLWGDAVALRAALDFAKLENTVEHLPSANLPQVREQRLRAAKLLLRADVDQYGPLVFNLVINPAERDVFYRAGLAQLLDTFNHHEGTDYLMHVIETEDSCAGFQSEKELDDLAHDFESHWPIDHYLEDRHDVAQWYATKMRGTAATRNNAR